MKFESKVDLVLLCIFTAVLCLVAVMLSVEISTYNRLKRVEAKVMNGARPVIFTLESKPTPEMPQQPIMIPTGDRKP